VKIPDWQRDLAQYDFQHTLTTQYSHLDTLRHVNNVAVQGMHIEARVRHQISVLGTGSLFSDDNLLRPRRTITHFLRETHFPYDVLCATRLVSVGDESYRLVTALFQQDECVGLQYCEMGLWGRVGWVELPHAIRAALDSHLSADSPSVSAWPDTPLDCVPMNAYPATGEISLRYADLDPDLVIGELAAATFVEHSRSSCLRPIRRSSANHAGLGMLVASVDLLYHRWAHATTSVQTGCAVERLGNSSFALASAILTGDERLLSGRSTMVLIDQGKRRPTPIVEPLRSAMAGLLLATDATAS